jgi:DAHL domain/Sigma-54 interaction domain/Bacterial regulatory protein, Fis family
VTKGAWLTVAGGLIILTFLLVESRGPDQARQMRIQSALHAMQLHDAELNRDVLLARAGVLHHYDSLSLISRKLAADLDILRTEAARLGQEKPRTASAEVAALADAVNRKLTLIEYLKSDNAVLRNSIAYFGESMRGRGGRRQDGLSASATEMAAAALSHVVMRFVSSPRAEDLTAADGTLFLDEIGDLTIPSQVKLLRLLQDGSYFPLGADRARQSRARVIVATNADVAQRVAAGSFRRDLYFRLRTHHLQLPPLRNRLGDLPLLVNHFVSSSAQLLGKTPPAVPPALYSLLKTYSFPGNIRELEAMVFDGVARHEGTVLSLQSFRDAIGGCPAIAEPEPADGAGARLFPDRLPTLQEAEQELIEEALERADGNQGVAASLLGISRQALNKRLNRRGRAEQLVRLPARQTP